MPGLSVLIYPEKRLTLMGTATHELRDEVAGVGLGNS